LLLVTVIGVELFFVRLFFIIFVKMGDPGSDSFRFSDPKAFSAPKASFAICRLASDISSQLIAVLPINGQGVGKSRGGCS
jgi:hypothetical protein